MISRKSLTVLGMAVVLSLFSCTETVKDETTIFGVWRLCSIRTEIRDYPDPPGEDNQFNSDVFYTFNVDSTYKIDDGDYEENGKWTFRDSILTLTPEDQSQATATSVRIVKLHGDSLIHESQADSDFGQIIEYMTLVKTKK